jgi:hypothetical protein
MDLTWNPPKIKSQTAEYHWTANYAVDVYFGTEDRDGIQGIDRPWVDVALSQNDFLEFFMAFYNERNPNVRAAFALAIDALKQAFDDVIDNHDWGIEGRNEKSVRVGVPTWKYITDSGELRDSLEVTIQ